jgi:hypothetical protein
MKKVILVIVLLFIVGTIYGQIPTSTIEVNGREILVAGAEIDVEGNLLQYYFFRTQQDTQDVLNYLFSERQIRLSAQQWTNNPALSINVKTTMVLFGDYLKTNEVFNFTYFEENGVAYLIINRMIYRDRQMSYYIQQWSWYL